MLEESENEQCQEVINKQNKRRVKKDNHASLLSMENSHNSNPKKIVEVKDKWVKVRVIMDFGAAGHVMLGTMFPRVSEKRHRRSLSDTMDMWVCLDKTGPVFQLAGKESGQAAFDKLVRPAALCRKQKIGRR